MPKDTRLRTYILFNKLKINFLRFLPTYKTG